MMRGHRSRRLSALEARAVDGFFVCPWWGENGVYEDYVYSPAAVFEECIGLMLPIQRLRAGDEKTEPDLYLRALAQFRVHSGVSARRASSIIA